MVPHLTHIQNLSAYVHASQLDIVFTDIDGTLTVNGLLPVESYEAIWNLTRKNIRVVPVTGRPAGWCEMIARLWPVAGIIGENGAFYFSYQNKTMHRAFETTPEQQDKNRKSLEKIFLDIKSKFPRVQVASDQFSRLCDLAVDFCEDVEPALTIDDANQIAEIFYQHGATAKVSSIHVNGWFGSYDKLKMCQRFAQERLGISLSANQDRILFVGDSPNDEPLFQFFRHSFAVSNIRSFLPQLKHPPAYISSAAEGYGFAEIVKMISEHR